MSILRYTYNDFLYFMILALEYKKRESLIWKLHNIKELNKFNSFS